MAWSHGAKTGGGLMQVELEVEPALQVANIMLFRRGKVCGQVERCTNLHELIFQCPSLRMFPRTGGLWLSWNFKTLNNEQNKT